MNLFFVVIVLVTLSNAQTCKDRGIPTKEFELDSFLQQFPTWVRPAAGGEYKTVLARSRAGTLYRSVDKGANWEEVSLPAQARVRYLLSSPDDISVIGVGYDNLLWISSGNEAQKFESFAAPAFFVSSSFTFHPRHYSWILALSTGNCNGKSGSTCSNDLYLTQDGGKTWKLVRKYVWAAAWHGLEDRDSMVVIWERRSKQGNQFDPPSTADISVSDNFWSDSKNVVIAGDTVGFLVMEGHIFFAQFGTTQRLVLKVSKDMGESFSTIDFPGELDEFRYRILDTSEGSTKIAVVHSPTSNWANVYGSVAADREFVLELPHVKCPTGNCDYGPVSGIEGVYIANQFASVTNDFGSKPHTVISYDKGAEWNSLSHPTGVAGSGELQIQGSSDAHISYYSVPEAIGIIFTNGNVGDSVSPDVADIGVYFSRDAGWTWQFVEPEPHIYEYGNRGAIVIMVKNEETTDLVQYSLNEGKTWDMCHFGTAFEVGNIISDPDFGTRHFLMYGNRGMNGIFVSVDFSDVHERDCRGWESPGTEGSDYEYWIPSDRNDDHCLLGRTMRFIRRKQEATCFNPLDFTTIDGVNVKNCSCTDENYECDYCYVRGPDGRACVPDEEDSGCKTYDPRVQPADCKGVWYESKGYQRVPGDTCDVTSGLNLLPVETPCSGTGPVPPKEGSNTGLIVFLVFVLILLAALAGVWFLSGRNAAVRDLVGKVVPERFLPDLVATESGYAPVSLGEVLDSEDDAPEVHLSEKSSSSSSP